MKSRYTVFIIIYLIIVSIFVIVVASKSFDRIIQLSIISGTGLGYVIYHQKKWPQTIAFPTLAFTIHLPVVVLIASGFLNQKFHAMHLASVLFIAFYLPVLFGYFLNKLRISDEIKLAILLGIIFVFLSAMTRKLNHGTSASITVLLATVVAVFASAKSKSAYFSFLLVFVGIFLFSNVLLGTFPEVLQLAFLFFCIVFICSFCYLVFFSVSKKRNQLFIIFTFSSFLSIFVWFGQENYEKWFFSNLENESISEAVNFHFTTTETKQISSEDLNQRKITILFWSEACINCKEEFPYFSGLANAYKRDTTKLFLAVYLSRKQDDTLYFNQVSKQSYHFKWAIAKDSEMLMNQLKMKGVPHMTILDTNNKVIYNGLVSNRPWIWVNSPSRFL